MSQTPWPQFSTWLEEATTTEPRVPESMQVATVSRAGIPSIRTVLLKAHGPEGLVFYTNLGSQKALELAGTPAAAFLLHYKGLERQVRGQGRVTPVSDADADAYFATRPRGSQISAWASRQSAPIDDRKELTKAVKEAEARFGGRDVPRPPFWGGFRIKPTRIEFWQGREDRLHDRTLYQVSGQGWRVEKLAP